MPDTSYYGVDEMRGGESNKILESYDKHKSEPFDNRRVLDSYFQDDVTVLRQACRVFKREFLQIGYIEVFLEGLTIASLYNKVLRRKFLKPDTIGLIPTRGYTCNK